MKKINQTGHTHYAALFIVIATIVLVGVRVLTSGHANQISTTSSGTATFKEFKIPTLKSTPTGITESGGNIWFSEAASNKIGMLTPSGLFQEFKVPTLNSSPHSISAARNGNIWFTEYNADKIGSINSAGVIHEYTIPTPQSQPNLIVAGINGYVWFTENANHDYGYIKTNTGIITEKNVYSSGKVTFNGITATEDGEIWLTGLGGIYLESPNDPSGDGGGGYPLRPGIIPGGIVQAQASKYSYFVWFAESNGAIGKAALGSLAGTYPVSGDPTEIANGPKSSLWFTEPKANRIGQLTYNGAATYYSVPTLNALPQYITVGPNGTLWFTELNSNKIGELIPG